MAIVDFEIIVDGKKYYARGSDTTDLFYSPLFENLEEYKLWASGDVVFEYEPLVFNGEDINAAKSAIEKLCNGEIPSEDEIKKLKTLKNINHFMSEFSNHDKEEELKHASSLGILDTFQQKYGGSIHDVIYIFLNNPDRDDEVFGQNFLKLGYKLLTGCLNIFYGVHKTTISSSL